MKLLCLFALRRAELQQEIDSHLKMAIADRVSRGEPEESALEAAIREFGNVTLIQDVTHSLWRWSWLESLLQDVCFALRQIRRSLFFATTVSGTLRLALPRRQQCLLSSIMCCYGLCPTATALRSSPFWQERAGKHADSTWYRGSIFRNGGIAVARFHRLLFGRRIGARNYLEEKTSALQVDGIRVSPNLFPTLGVEP